MYFKQAEAAIIVYDVTNDLSFEKAQKWVKDLEDQEEADNSPILKFLIGNKCDLVNEKVVQVQQGSEFGKEIGASFSEVSAKENIGIQELFKEIAVKLHQKSAKSNSRARSHSTLDKNDSKKKKTGCC